MNELYQQREICKSLKIQGGHGHKYPSAGFIGWPDLILLHPEFNTVFLEVKIIKNIAKVDWTRKIYVSPKQEATMEMIKDMGGRAFVGVVSYYSPQKAFLTILPSHIGGLDEQTMLGYTTTVQRQPKTGYDVVRAINTARMTFR